MLTNRREGGPGFAYVSTSVERREVSEPSPGIPAAAVEPDARTSLIFSRLHALALLHKRVQAAYCRRQFSVNRGESQLIGIVHELGKPSCKRICEVSGLDKGQVSRLIKRMTRQGLLVRSVHPTRRQTISVALTTRGRTLARLVRTATLRLNRESLAAVPRSERAIFSAVMNMLTEKVRLMLHEERHAAGRRRKRSPAARHAR